VISLDLTAKYVGELGPERCILADRGDQLLG
jgi:hypothetical protein